MTVKNEMLSALRQEVKDFKEEGLARLTRIEAQTTKTNGRVNTNESSFALLNQAHNNCPAKKYHENESKSTQWSRIGLVITFLLTTVMLLYNIYHASTGGQEEKQMTNKINVKGPYSIFIGAWKAIQNVLVTVGVPAIGVLANNYTEWMPESWYPIVIPAVSMASYMIKNYWKNK